MKCTPLVQGTPVGDVFHPTAIRDEPFLSYHVLKLVSVKFGEAPFLGDVDLGEKNEVKSGTGHKISILLVGTYIKPSTYTLLLRLLHATLSTIFGRSNATEIPPCQSKLQPDTMM